MVILFVSNYWNLNTVNIFSVETFNLAVGSLIKYSGFSNQVTYSFYKTFPAEDNYFTLHSYIFLHDP